ncbi:MAG: hypothetical protein NTV94_18435 [Planctomycetota bacterium]|nr:hypothetical protein [Planctomycetota bacterium]
MGTSILAALLVSLISAQPASDHTDSAQSSPRYWRGNLHTHTFWSDGDDFPEMVVDWYAKHEYNFLAISDHNTMQHDVVFKKLADLDKRSRGKAFQKYLDRFGSNWVETRGSREAGTLEVRLKPFHEYRSLFDNAGRFIMIPAEEITAEAANKRAIHINATNLIDLIKPQQGATVAEVIARTTTIAKEQAQRTGREILVHVNHPNYKWGVTAEDLAAIINDRFFEVWNGVDNDNDPGNDVYPSTDQIWDIANTLRIAAFRAEPLLGLATDDSHDYHQDTIRAMPGRGWVMVRASHLTPESLIRAMRRGDFYASSGVELESVTFDAQTRQLSLKIKPCKDEKFVTRFVGTRKGANMVGTPRRASDGSIVETTLDYTVPGKPVIGETLATVDGQAPSYTLKGDELYVRAIVTSSGIPDFPTKESQLKKAWTQPVGWESRMAPASK